MRRWNGWGDESVQAALAPQALAFLRERVGAPQPRADATLAQAGAALPVSRFADMAAPPGLDCSAEARLRHSHGQSLGDWIALRFGEIGPVCDGVARPDSVAALRDWLDWAARVGAGVIPVGGATSVLGHLRPPQDSARPWLALSLAGLNRLLELDELAQIARFEAGVQGPALEASLRARGLTLGHYPQSFEYASLGGWVVTRSSGQQSLRYGRAEQWFAGGRLLLAEGGELQIPAYPASAAGPDLREWVLGSEGRFGVLAEVAVRVQRAPACEQFIGVFFPDWAAGLAATRELAQCRVPLSMLRLATAVETETTLRLAGHARQIGLLERYLRLRGCGAAKVLLFIGVSGSAAQVAAARREALQIARAAGGVATGELLGRAWASKRFAGVYLRNALWDAGYMVDTMETALPWGQTTAMVEAIEGAGRAALAGVGERCHAYTHLSHVYASGSSVYSTFVMRLGRDAAESRGRWQRLKSAVSQAIVDAGGTISHQHGVGKDHAAYLGAEKGEVGLQAIDAAIRHFDPQGLFASGNLR